MARQAVTPPVGVSRAMMSRLQRLGARWRSRSAIPADTLDDVEARVGGGAAGQQLLERVGNDVDTLFTLFPHAAPSATDVVVHIAPRLGYVMQAMANRFPSARLIALDVSLPTIAHAKARLQRDGVDTTGWEFRCLDGLRMPFADRSIDKIYSVGSRLDMVKGQVYHLLAEALRIMRDGHTAVQLPSYSALRKQQRVCLAPTDSPRETGGEPWNQFYSQDELSCMLTALGAKDVSITEHDDHLWAAFR